MSAENSSISLTEKLNAAHARYILLEKESLERRKIKEKNRVLEIINDTLDWKFSKNGIPSYNIPKHSMWIDICNYSPELGREFYRQIAEENNLQLAHDSGKTYTFVFNGESD